MFKACPLHDNTYYHSDKCYLPCLKEAFREKPHLEGLLKGRRWNRVRTGIEKMKRPSI
jgi:hypothetical protein